MKFEKKFEVRYSELDSMTGNAGLISVVSYFQDTTMAQTEMLMRDEKARKEAGKFLWYLLSWQVKIMRYPAHGEKLTARTWATKFNGVYGYRDFDLCDENGEKIAAASTVWVALEPSSGRMKKCTPEIAAFYGVSSERAFEAEEPWKMAIPKETQEVAEFEIRHSDIDTNKHVNNVNYVIIALDAVNPDKPVTDLRVNYKKAAVFGDRICISTQREGGSQTCLLSSPQGDVFAVVRLG